jgi:pimeloyl-ACP methyl ester carboxylesterase
LPTRRNEGRSQGRGPGGLGPEVPGALLTAGTLRSSRLHRGVIRCVDPTVRPQILVLVNGYLTSDWRRLARHAEQRGFHVDVYAYSVLIPTLQALASDLAQQIREHLATTGAADVHLVGHSYGGLIARAAVQSGWLRGAVANLVTVAAPHRGAPLARLDRISAASAAMRPGSPQLAWLDSGTVPAGTRFTTVVAGDDRIVPRSRQVPATRDAEAVVIEDERHNDVLRSSRFLDLITELLEAPTPATPARRLSVADSNGVA